MDASLQAGMKIADGAVLSALDSSAPLFPAPGGKIDKRLRAVWISGATEYDLGVLTGFAGKTSFSGTSGSITFAWPGEKNPRTAGSWQNLLVPSDSVRIKVARLIAGVETPLLMGVPVPGGIREIYGGSRETVEIKIGDVTAVAGRMTNYTVPNVPGDSIDANLAVKTILSPIEHIIFYETADVSSCIEVMPNALMAADEVLIGEQNSLVPLAGQKRIRYGDRTGRIVYRLMADPAQGGSFTPRLFAGPTNFDYTENRILRDLRIEPEYINFSVGRINPYLELGSRINVRFARGNVNEIVEVHGIGYRFMPNEERMTIKARRQLTL